MVGYALSALMQVVPVLEDDEQQLDSAQAFIAEQQQQKKRPQQLQLQPEPQCQQQQFEQQFEQQQRPGWLHTLLTAKFFTGCGRHEASKKNETNILCIDCAALPGTAGVLCQHCLPAHRDHNLIQIRRYVYHDVVRLSDIGRLLDWSGVQTYIINGARVVFLNQRPQHRPSKPGSLSNACETCDRSLQDAYRFCSVCCKVDAVFKRGGSMKELAPSASRAKDECKARVHSSSNKESSSNSRNSSDSFDGSFMSNFVKKSRSRCCDASGQCNAGQCKPCNVSSTKRASADSPVDACSSEYTHSPANKQPKLEKLQIRSPSASPSSHPYPSSSDGSPSRSRGSSFPTSCSAQSKQSFSCRRKGNPHPSPVV